jgi:hypothetical protein
MRSCSLLGVRGVNPALWIAHPEDGRRPLLFHGPVLDFTHIDAYDPAHTLRTQKTVSTQHERILRDTKVLLRTTVTLMQHTP